MLARPVHVYRTRPPLLPSCRRATSATWETARLSARNVVHLTVGSKRPSLSFTPMATLVARRPHSSQSPKGKEPARDVREDHQHDHEEHDHDHSHSHSHSIFGSLSHSHSHTEESHADADKVVEALKGGGDRGSRITLIGLASNVGLTISKGAAGWYMNSASLLADAGHTAGDLIGDVITLACWKLSRRPPSELYPYGFGKFEVLGSAAISLLLTGGAVGLGLHSLSLLGQSLSHVAVDLPAGVLQDVLVNVTNVTSSIPTVASDHGHEHALDPNAAWFAGIGIIAKEWLYRATKKVADEESSSVLLANAVHHRSDAYSSLVALVAILGTWWFPSLPLDPIGGLLVSILIVQQGWAITVAAFRQLTDASVTPQTRITLLDALEPLLPSNHGSTTPSQIEQHTENLLSIKDLRAMRAGALMFVDLTAEVPRMLSVEDASTLEGKIARTLKQARKEIAEVRVKFHPTESDEVL